MHERQKSIQNQILLENKQKRQNVVHVPYSTLPWLRFCICIIMYCSHLNDMEIPGTKRFILKGLSTTLG